MSFILTTAWQLLQSSKCSSTWINPSVILRFNSILFVIMISTERLQCRHIFFYLSWQTWLNFDAQTRVCHLCGQRVVKYRNHIGRKLLVWVYFSLLLEKRFTFQRDSLKAVQVCVILMKWCKLSLHTSLGSIGNVKYKTTNTWTTSAQTWQRLTGKTLIISLKWSVFSITSLTHCGTTLLVYQQDC